MSGLYPRYCAPKQSPSSQPACINRLMKVRDAGLVWLLCLLVQVSARSQSYDIVIRHGRVVDGTGNPAFFGDVAIKDHRIAAIGRIGGNAKPEIDAQGLIVAPGFIDVHTHADEIADMPKAENFVRMGVTTIVAGNCGSSTLDVASVFRAVEKKNVAGNFATLVGQKEVGKKAIGGSFVRPATPPEGETTRPPRQKAV